MAGYILLEGGAEFGGGMAAPDRRALELAGGPSAPVRIIPAAAAPDNNHRHAGSNGERWFRSLGASNVSVLGLIDRQSADNHNIAAALRYTRLIYLLGGFTRYLEETLAGSLAWQTIVEAHADGAVVAGSSAGAMVLCQYYYDPENRLARAGLGLVANACVIPHHNTFGSAWAPLLRQRLPSTAVLVGIDEHTGALDDGGGGAWTVYGSGSVTLYRGEQAEKYQAGQRFRL
jgi:cyanophycinase